MNCAVFFAKMILPFRSRSTVLPERQLFHARAILSSTLYFSLAYAIVESSAFSAWRESSRVCCTTMGTSDSITLA